MAILDTVGQIFRREAQRKTNVVLPADHISPQPEDTGPAVAGEAYFRLWVVQMLLKRDRDWFKSWYPLVHAMTAFSFGDIQSPLEVAQVAGPSQLRDLDDAHLDRTVGQNYPLTPLVPFRGGTVQIRAGLMALKADDTVQRFVNVMGSFAKLVTVPQLSAAIGVVSTISSGVQELLGVGDKQLLLGYIDSFVGADGPLSPPDAVPRLNGGSLLRPCYIAVLNSPSGTYDPKLFWVRDRNLLYGPDAAAAEELTGVDYILLQLELRQQRDDWDQLTSINEPFSKSIEALGKLDPNTGEPKLAEAEAFVRGAAIAALNSYDLTTRDRMRVARAVRERFKRYQDALQDGGRAGEAPTPPTIFDVAATARGLSSAEVSLSELLRE